MSGMEFATASAVYECSRGTAYTRLRLHHPGFYRFSRDISRLRRLCEAEAALQDVYVDRFLRTAERYRYYVSAAPVSFARCPLNNSETMQVLEGDAKTLGVGWPALRETSAQIMSVLMELIEEDLAPYLECAACLFCKPTVEREAMVVCPTNLLAAARETVDELIGPDALPLLSPAELKSGATYDRLLLAGPFSWFTRYASHVLTAPRAHQMVSVSYDWLPDSWRPESAFVHSEACSAYLPGLPGAIACKIMAPRPDIQVLDEGVLPDSAVLFEAVTVSAARERAKEELDSDPVPTRGFLLEPASLLLVEDDPDARMLVIDFAREIGSQIVKLPISDIESGMFLLHRSTGGGDYVVDVANRIMGRQCEHLRGRQALWKARLRARAARDGYEAVALDLLRCGSAIASYQNVRNWLSTRNIMTNARTDFDAIMMLAGLAEESETLWLEMKAIRRAHLQAGVQIKKLLLRQVARADSVELLRLGYWDFDLGNDDGGVLSAQRVLEIVDHTPTCPSGALPLYREI